VQPASIRRSLVFGVCALGVTALYLVPGLDRASVAPDADRADRQATDAQPPVAYDAHAQLASASRSIGASAHEVSAGSGVDQEPPSTVSDLTFPVVTSGRLTVRWPAANDNVGVATYRVWLNGYHVADTTNLQIAIPWFKDGSQAQVVQVRAVDEAGNESVSAPARLVARPAPVAIANVAGGAG
jgi:hypothetical protein